MDNLRQYFKPLPIRADHHANTISILIADDHQMVREVVARFLVASGDFKVCLSESFSSTLASIKNEMRYDIVMLDLVMPGMVGIDTIGKVVSANAGGRVVLFSSRVDRFTQDRALEMGVKGIIPKTLPSASLISALKFVHSGEIFLPFSMIENKLLGEKSACPLNETELFILRLAAEGLTNKHIANDIDLSEAVIKMHMRAICTKLKARNRAHAAILGRELGLLER